MRNQTKNLLDKGEMLKGLKFLISIIAFYTLFWLILSSINLYPLKAFTASSANDLLNAAGVPTQLSYGTEPTIIVAGVGAEINNLCAGDLEIALLLAIILSTWDRSWHRRIWGCIFGLLIIFIVNPLRIFIVLFTGHAAGWSAADAVHDLLFRAILIGIILVYYFLWYVKYDWFMKKLRIRGKGKKKRRKR